MESEQRIQALEQEVQILKTQIQSILLDIQAHLLTNAYPALRGHHTSNSAPAEDDDDDDEYDRASRPVKVKKVTANGSAPVKAEKAEKEPTPAFTPVRQAEPMMASLDEQQAWVLENIQSVGVAGTRDLIETYTQKRRFTPEVSDTLMRFTDIYAAAAEEQTLPSRPALPGPTVVKAAAAPPLPSGGRAKSKANGQTAPQPPGPVSRPGNGRKPARRVVEPPPEPEVYDEPDYPATYGQPAYGQQPNRSRPTYIQPNNGQGRYEDVEYEETGYQETPYTQTFVKAQYGQMRYVQADTSDNDYDSSVYEVNQLAAGDEAAMLYEPPIYDQNAYFNPADLNAGSPDEKEEIANPNLVLRLIAGVQNAGAGVRWGKKA